MRELPIIDDKRLLGALDYIDEKYIAEVYANEDVNEALYMAKGMCDEHSIICVCGSLYLLGDVLI